MRNVVLSQMSGISIECKVRQILPLGSHDMFIGEAVGIDVSEEYIGENGLVDLGGADLIAGSSRKLPNHVPVGSYVKLGETIGRRGFTAGKDIRTHERQTGAAYGSAIGRPLEKRRGANAMLINCSNHPSRLWGPSQRAAASAYGEILDIPFPQVDPRLDEAGLRRLVGDFAARIEALGADAVFLAGEFTFLFMLVDKLLRDGENVICACSRRETEEVLRADGASEKRAVFVFERL